MSQFALLEVRHGLMLAHSGFRMRAGAVIASAVCVLFLWDPFALTVASGCLLISATVVGGVVGFLGRAHCLATPPEFPVARARIRLAVLLEGCGLLIGVVNLGVGWAVTTWRVPLPVEVWCSVFPLALTLFVAGRVFFYAFTVALAKAVDMKPAAQPSVAPVMAIIMGSMVMASAVGLQVIAWSQTEPTLHAILIAGGTFLAAVGVFGTLYAIGRWYRRLREAVTQFNARPAEPSE